MEVIYVSDRERHILYRSSWERHSVFSRELVRYISSKTAITWHNQLHYLRSQKTFEAAVGHIRQPQRSSKGHRAVIRVASLMERTGCQWNVTTIFYWICTKLILLLHVISTIQMNLFQENSNSQFLKVVGGCRKERSILWNANPIINKACFV